MLMLDIVDRTPKARRLSALASFLLVTFSSSMLMIETARACTMTSEFFDYGDGSLNGRNGGSDGVGALWTGAWGVVDDSAGGGSDTPANTFEIVGGKVEATDTGGELFQIAREMDLSGTTQLGYGIDSEGEVPIHNPGTSFFTTEMAFSIPTGTTRSLSTPGAWNAGVQFSDSYGDTAGFGIDANGTNSRFYGRLGSTIGYSTKEAEENTSYWLYAVLDHDWEGTQDERLRVWVNPTYSDMYNGFNPDIDLYDDLESGLAPGIERTELGTEVALTIQTSSAPGASAPIVLWDDPQVARDIEFLSVPRIDIGSDISRIQEAFEEWNVSALPAAQATFSFDQQAYYPSLDPNTYLVDITMESVNALNDLVSHDTAPTTSALNDDLRRDGLTSEEGIQITLDGLLGDQYLLKIFAYHPTDATDVTVSMSYDGLVWHDRGSYTTATGDQRALETMVFFDNHDLSADPAYLAAGVPIYIRFLADDPTETVSISGLQFVPEPGTGLLLGMGLGIIAWRRRKG
ncbi:MAG: hypothetical protein CL917_03895 [Deltaproteobacteria bacterium]|nr:hypothetical protein [Deltaproteobacteria bacterium]